MEKRRLRWMLCAAVVGLGGGCELIAGLGDPMLDNMALCSDGIKDGNETGKDCGGNCAGCPPGGACQVGSDCASKLCSAGTCLPSACDDKVKNGKETDIDCGGMCSPCGPTKTCSGDGDCRGGKCLGGTCAETCTDGVKDGSETGVDCGGGPCPPCKGGQGCSLSDDCESSVCVGGKCVDNYVWAKGFGDQGADSRGTGLAVDGAGDVTLTGALGGTADFGGGTLTSAGLNDIFVAKFGPTGNNLWSKRFGDASNQAATSVAADSVGNVVITGVFSGVVDFGDGAPHTSAGGIGDVFITKLDTSGKCLWSIGTGGVGFDFGTGVAIDTAGNIFATGQFTSTVNFGSPLNSAGSTDVYLVRFGPNGIPSWSKRFGDANAQSSSGVAVDKLGDVVLTGSFSGTVDFGGGPLVSAGASDMFVAKFASSGNHLWSKSFGDSADQFARAVANDSSGNIVVAGNFAGALDFSGNSLISAGENDMFLAKFDPQGNHLWSKSFGDANDQDASGVTVDAADEIALFGSGEGTIDFGGGPLASAGGPMGGNDLFVARFDATGNHLWSRRFGDAQLQTSTGIAAADKGSLFITGSFSGLLYFSGGSVLMNSGGTDIFLAKLLTP